MLGSHRRLIEREHPAALEDPVDDGVCQVLVVKHASQAVRALFVVKIMARLFRCRSFTTWKSMFAASVPYVR
jgi:hypothetical protein